MVINYTASNYENEGKYQSTFGEFKLQSGTAVTIGSPIKISSQGLESNKYWVEPYTDTDGLEVCLGVAVENRVASGTIPAGYDTPAGMDWTTRDIAFATQGGPMQMRYISGTRVTNLQDIVAPHPSGFQMWQPGMNVLGTVLQHGVPTGSDAMVWLGPRGTENNWVTETFTGVADQVYYDLDHIPISVESVTTTSGTVIFGYKPIRVEDPTAGHVRISGTTLSGLTFLAGDQPATDADIYVRYSYRG